MIREDFGACEVCEVFGLEGKVFHALIEHPAEELTKQELAEEAGISLTFLNKYYPKLEKYGVVVKTRRIGKAALFRANLENDLIKMFRGWLLERARAEEIARARKIHKKHYKGKDDEIEIALLDILADINAKIKPDVGRELEKRGFILTKDGKRYFTQIGYDVANSIKEFNKVVLEQD